MQIIRKLVYYAGVAALLSACSPSEQKAVSTPPPNPTLHTETCPYLIGNTKVVAYGDPVTAADGNLSAKSFLFYLPDAFQNMSFRIIPLEPKIVTSSDMLDALPALMEDSKEQAQFVIISAGLYDISRDITPEETLKNLVKMGEIIKNSGRYPIFVAFPEINGVVTQLLGDSTIFSSLKAQGFYVLNMALSKALANPQYRVDSLRPNAEGHKVAGALIKEQLRKCTASHLRQMGEERKRLERIRVGGG